MKAKLGPVLSLYPMPTVVVGALVQGKPNPITIAHVGIMDLESVSISLHKPHYTNPGIRETGTFSINIPSESQVAETDYCGLVSGRNTDKSKLFDWFYGELKTAPMIGEFPLNMECRLVRTVDFPKHDLFVGEIVQTYCSEECMTDGVIDFSKIRPILFVMHDKSYWKLGDRFAGAWSIGKALKRKDP
jgi:flavin reductase (DIM6/NTAB) family NADH-FMN oxidoreductase RutF